MKIKGFMALLICYCWLIGAVSAQVIEQGLICSNVVDLKPIKPKVNFEQGQKAYCWLKVTEAPVGGKIIIDWYLNLTIY